MKSERVVPVLGFLLALILVVLFAARRRAGVALPGVSEAPSNGGSGSSDKKPSDKAQSSEKSSYKPLSDDPLVDEMGQESFPASDPPATY
jgi:hypothetical protein